MKKYILIFFSCLFAFSLNAQCVDNGNYWNQSWISCNTSANPNPERGNTRWILYEFDTPHFIDSTHIWNANRPGESGSGVKDIIIDYSTDGTNWEALGGFFFPQAPETNDYEGFTGPSFNSVLVEKILFTVLTTHDGGDCASLAEVQFKIDTETCYGIIDECGICDGPGALTWYLDADEDGLGDANTSIMDCDQPIGYVADNSDVCDNGALGWDEIAPLFADNGCNGCHNGNAAGGLDLRSYETTITGGNICGTNLFVSDHFVQTIITTGYNGCGTAIGIPSMNDRSSGDFDANELAMLQKWINGDAPKICTDFNFVVDADQDGFDENEDCDDNDPNINPNAEEIPNNGIDEDCDGNDLMTAVHEINNQTVSIFPNPVAEKLSIAISGNWDYQVRLFDLNGRLLLQENNVESINVSEFPSGSYLFELEELDKNQTIIERIIISR